MFGTAPPQARHVFVLQFRVGVERQVERARRSAVL